MEVKTFFNSVKNLVTIQIIAGNGSKQSFGSGISNWKKNRYRKDTGEALQWDFITGEIILSIYA